MNKRNFLPIALVGLVLLGLPSVAGAQAAATAADTASSSGFNPNFLLLGAAILQVVVILSLNSVMRLLGGSGKVWTDRARKAGTAALVLLMITGTSDANAAMGPTQWTSNQLFYVLVVVNLLLFVLMLAQVNLLRNMTRTLVGRPEDEAPAVSGVRVKKPSFESKLLQLLTRQVSIEKEQDVLMHHEYDGIRELDNALPPWWLWMFYGCIIWAVVYLVNVHVTGVWPDQKTEYELEMAQAKADVDAYVARLGASVDENTVTLLTDAGNLNTGKGLFEANCVACHGAAAEGKSGLGPNLTDPYWIHGGGIKNVFTTIKYGVTAKGMIAWKTQMKANELHAVASYVLSLQGSNPANAQAPQGDLWKEEGATASDSTLTVPVDSISVPADSLKSQPKLAQVQ